MAPQSLAMCLRPATPRILTEPVSYGVIDFSKRVSREELDRADRLWREKRKRNGTAIQVVHNGITLTLEEEKQQNFTCNRASFESNMTRVEGRQYHQQLQRETTIATSSPSSSTQSKSTSRAAMEQRSRKSSPVKSLFFLRKPSQSQVVV